MKIKFLTWSHKQFTKKKKNRHSNTIEELDDLESFNDTLESPYRVDHNNDLIRNSSIIKPSYIIYHYDNHDHIYTRIISMLAKQVTKTKIGTMFK